MSRNNVLAPRLSALCVVATAVAVAGSIAMPAARAANEQKRLDKPALLWKSYPLNPRPHKTKQVAPVRHAPVRHEAIERTTGPDTGLRNLVLVAALLVMLLGVSTLVFTRRPAAARISVALRAPARIGVALGGRVRAARPRRASRHRPKRKPRPAQVRPPRREVIPHLVRAPKPGPIQAAEPERSDDLLEALQPTAPQVAPPPDRRELQKEIETRHGPIEAEPKPARAAEPPARTTTQTLLVTLLGVATLVFTRRPVPVRIGVALRGRVRAARPRRAPRQPKREPRPARVRPRLREVIPHLVRTPKLGPIQAAEPERSDDLLEALQPEPPQVAPPPDRRELEKEIETPHLVAAPEPAPTQAAEPEHSDDLLEGLQPKAPQLAPPPDRRELQKEIETRPGPIEAAPKAVRAAEPPARKTTQTQPVHARLRNARREATSVAACEIRLWRGFVKCQLYATDMASGAVLAESPYFRLRVEDGPSPDAQKALSALLTELELRGWHVESDGPSWYHRRLQLVEQDLDESPLPLW